MDLLDMSKPQILTWATATHPLPIDKITVGAAITRHRNSSTEILLLKRHADEVYYPNVCEIPGGKMDDTDTSIRDTIIRAVAEETNLVVSSIVSALPTITYTTEKPGVDGPVIRRALQLSYVVTVKGNGSYFGVNPSGHSMGLFASEHDLKKIEMIDEMRSLVSAALGAEA